MQRASRPNKALFGGGLVLLILAAFLCLFIGRYHISLREFLTLLRGVGGPGQGATVLFSLRLPRILASLLVGAALAISGATYQAILRNPLVAPDMLGVSSGACVGAFLSIYLGLSQTTTQLVALFGGLLAVGLAMAIPRLIGNSSVMSLVLSGVIVGGFMSAALGLLKYVADPDTQLASMTYWQLGSLAETSWRDVRAMSLPILGCLLLVFLLRFRLNILSLGDDEAKSLGIDVLRLRRLLILCATLLTATSVCSCGTIGWIGLVIPHMSRLFVGADHRMSIPCCALLGAFFLLLIDTLARTLTMAEIPLSILTGLLGAPTYFFLLLRQGRNLQ